MLPGKWLLYSGCGCFLTKTKCKTVSTFLYWNIWHVFSGFKLKVHKFLWILPYKCILHVYMNSQPNVLLLQYLLFWWYICLLCYLSWLYSNSKCHMPTSLHLYYLVQGYFPMYRIGLLHGSCANKMWPNIPPLMDSILVEMFVISSPTSGLYHLPTNNTLLFNDFK